MPQLPTDYWQFQEHEADLQRSEERAEARARGVVADCDLPFYRWWDRREMTDELILHHQEFEQRQEDARMSLSQYFKSESKYLKADDLKEGQEVRLTIKDVQVEVLEQDSGRKEVVVLYFSGKEKGLLLNATNGNKITGAYGDDANAVKGKEIILYRDQTEFRGQSVPCLRVRIPTQEVPAEDIPF